MSPINETVAWLLHTALEYHHHRWESVCKEDLTMSQVNMTCGMVIKVYLFHVCLWSSVVSLFSSGPWS